VVAHANHLVGRIDALAEQLIRDVGAEHDHLVGAADILRGTDLRVQLISQLMLEVVLGSALFLWIQKLSGQEPALAAE
jgi:hypothetical protein